MSPLDRLKLEETRAALRRLADQIRQVTPLQSLRLGAIAQEIELKLEADSARP